MLALSARLLILDGPVSALDVSIRWQVLDLLLELGQFVVAPPSTGK